jgi:Dyp-type peroxidase family
MAAFTDQQLQEIQGFGIAGFSKDHQETLFIHLGGATEGKKLLAWLAPQVANAWETGTFNQVFSEVRHRTGLESIEATWVALMISASGYGVLGVPTSDLPPGEGTTAFSQGMSSRSSQIGDTRPGDEPTGWLPEFQPGTHLAIVVASDDESDLDERVAAITDQISEFECEVVFQERGRTLPPPLTGHEHFGFKDGISQPAITDYDPASHPSEPPSVSAGEFVLGFPDNTGTMPASGPNWQNGSFVVFRRLTQDVAGFRAQTAFGVPGATPPVAPQQVASDMVGRWPSGAPLELNPTTDPGPDGVTNAFQYNANNDAGGQICPVWAHVRKVNPRDETTPGGASDDPTRHRMIRRGIPFGPPLASDATGDDGCERGLHFFSVVSDLDKQFEFIQRNWLNNPNFPGGTPTPNQPSPYGPPAQGSPNGPDPLVGEFDPGANCVLEQASGPKAFPISHELVHVTGGEYFFLPAITVIAAIGTLAGPPAAA